ncbi:Sister chromatid cohesion protein 2 [Mortierella sp. AM989]|nr:Sister chromatid cohesion protein 2 [Mortierella sp. AM989]
MAEHGSSQQSQGPEPAPPVANQQRHAQTATQHSLIKPQFDTNVQPKMQLPTNAQSGLQYTAFASITSTDSVLRDLPSLSIAFQEFRLMQQQDPVVQEMLALQGLSQHGFNFQCEYLKTIIANANVENIRFQPPSQITASKDSFTPHFEEPLSALAESILGYCSQSSNENFDAGHIYQLPKIDPFDVLRQFQCSSPFIHPSAAADQPPATIPAVVVEQHSERNRRPPIILSQKRGMQDSTDDECEFKERESKKVRSGDAPVFAPNRFSLPQEKKQLDIDPQISSHASTQSHSSPLRHPAVKSISSPLIYVRPALSVQDIDPTLDFDDMVNQLLEDVTNDLNKPRHQPVHISSHDLKQIGRTIDYLSKQGLLEELRIDSISSILKYLETSMSHFASVDPAFLNDYELSEEDQCNRDRVARILDQISLSLEHVTLSLLLFDKKGLQQHLFPEELLIDTLSVFKLYLDKFLVPLLELSKDSVGTPKDPWVFKAVMKDEFSKSRMLSLVGTTCEISERLRSACCLELSDQIIVKLVYTALTLFFIDTSSELMLGHTEAESMRQTGSSLLRKIYAKHPNQRSWILEENLSLLIKLPHGKKVTKGYRLIDGTRIHSSSALLMQLVHTGFESPLSVTMPSDFREIHQSAQRIEMQKLLDIIKVTQEEAKASIIYILNFLLSRCTKGSKSSIETDYRIVLDSLLSDLLTVLGQPEWPSAELYLLLISKAMIRFLDDPKADAASKTMAVDTLGSIASKVKTVLNQLAEGISGDNSNIQGERQPFYGVVDIETKPADLLYLQASYSSVVEYLGSSEVNDSAAKSAKNMWISQWTYVICNATTKDAPEKTWDNACWTLVVEEISKHWKLYNSQELRLRSKTSLARSPVIRRAVCLTARQQLFNSFDTLLSRILAALEGGAVTLRAKALKALSLIVTGDYAVLAQQNVRNIIALRLQDQSPSVRDAATDLVGKYMLQDALIRKAYYEIVSDRISDTGLNVRKRVIRLLRDVFHKVDSFAMRLNISQKLLLRVNDEEAAVKDLAIKSVSEVWFSPFIEATNLSMEELEGAQGSPSALISITSTQKREVSKHARTLVSMVGKLSTPQDEALGSVIKHLLKKENHHGSFDLAAQGQEFTRSFAVLVDCLVDLMQTLQDEDAAKSAVASTVHTLHIFVKSEPRLIEAKHLSALLVYLHCSSTSEDWRVTMFVLRIFQDTVPVIHGMSTNDSQMAEKLVLALVAKCPVVLLPEATNVFCLIVNTLTCQYDRLCKFFQTCVDLLNIDAEKLRSGTAIQENKTRRLMTIVGLLCRHFSFEQAIKDNPTQIHLAELKSKMPPTIQEYVFKVLAPLCEPEYSRALQQTALQSIGHVFMSFPALLNSQQSLGIMDSVFAGQDNELKSELLLIYSNFMVKIQATPAIEQSKDSNYSLIAKAEDHIEAGIGSAIMQRYLDRILQCVLVIDKRLQAAAVDVITQVTQQALVHPMLCMPAIVALETSEDPSVSGKIFKIHRDLHQKHASLIYARSMECIRTMYIYQKTILHAEQDVLGFKINTDTGDAISLLAPMYSLVGDKRQVRNSLLSALVKVLDVDLTVSEVEVDGIYSRFIAEILAYLEYKTMEEVLLVIFLLNRIIAGSGMSILQSITEMGLFQRNSIDESIPKKIITRRGRGNNTERPGSKANLKKSEKKKGPVPSHLNTDNNLSGSTEGRGQSSKNLHSWKKSSNAGDEKATIIPANSLAKACVVVEAAMELKSHLKRIYDINETKCQQFQPTSHASHKDKPLPRFTGTIARIQWKLSTHELNLICGKQDVAEGDVIFQCLIRKQLEQFQQMIEMETVERLYDENSMESHSSHMQEPGSYRSYTINADQTSDDTDEDEDEED